MQEKKWIISSPPATSSVTHLSKQLNLNTTLTSILISRGIDTFDKAKTFFRPSLSQLHDPFLMKDMDVAVSRIQQALFSKEKILIYGDYDVDGTTSVTLVYDFLSRFTSCDYYIPDRYNEGYGVSSRGIDFAIENKHSLIISLDCGIQAVAHVERARNNNIDFIICDHHTPGEELPPAFAILDPKRSDCQYPFKELSGCGVGFKLLHALCIKEHIDEDELLPYLDLLTVSIASDIVPIIDENRIFASMGLGILNKKPRPGLQALIKVSKCQKPLDISSVVFAIGPRINAAGRMAHGSDAVELLLSKDQKEANELAKKIDLKNNERRTEDKSTTEEAIDMISANGNSRVSNVVFKKEWHKGIIGIVASRCVEEFYRPTIVLAGSNDVATGSARSIPGFNIYEAISKCSDLLVQFGGHKYAAGLTIEQKNIEKFEREFEKTVASIVTPELMTPTLDIDIELSLASVTDRFYSIIDQMAPFGPANLRPVFCSMGLYLIAAPEVIKDAHLKLLLCEPESGKVFEAIGFGMSQLASKLLKNSVVDVAYQIDENRFRGRSLQLILKDLKIHGA